MTNNKAESDFECDGLRMPEHLCEPDPCTRSFVRVDNDSGVIRSLSPVDQFELVAGYTLSDAVPEKIRILFDTARNLYLYSWFVYRFYNVAEQQVFGCLEMAIRERLKDEMPLPEKYWPKKRQERPPSLKAMLHYVIDRGYIQNVGFRTWRDRGIARARQRYETERMQEMREKGLESIKIDYSEVVVTDEDLQDEQKSHMRRSHRVRRQ
ncbi:MAG: hypothetical protein WCX93_01070 [Burkholderiaceae bacterium]